MLKDLAAFNEFIEGLTHFLNTGKIDNVCARTQKVQFTRIVDDIKLNLDTENTESNETHILHKNPKKGIQIEQRGLNLVSVFLHQNSEPTHHKQTLKTFSNVAALRGFINAYPLISTACGSHDFHQFLVSIRHDDIDYIKYNLNPEKTGPHNRHILHTDTIKGIQLEQRGLKIITVSIDDKGNPTSNLKKELKTFSSVNELQGFIDGYPLLSAAGDNLHHHQFLLNRHHLGIGNIRKNINAGKTIGLPTSPTPASPQ